MKLTKAFYLNNICCKEVCDLNKLSTILIGKRGLVIYPDSVEKVAKCIEIIKENNASAYYLSGGSNTLFLGEYTKSVLISSRRLNKIHLSAEGVYAESGVTIGDLIKFCKTVSLSGVEKFVGVPSRIGGMVKMNFGCNGLEMSDIIESVSVISGNGKLFTLNNSECGFSYRNSDLAESFICGANIKLSLDTLRESNAIRNEYFQKRSASQPLNLPSLGCVFKSCNGISAGKLIDSLGLKGTRCGGAEISIKHAGFIVNSGGASSNDVLKLIDIAREKVYNEYRIELKTEIVTVF